MPQVNTLAIDIAPSNDFIPVQSGSSSSSESSGKDFAKVIDQHYQAQQGGKSREESGNKSKIAEESQPGKSKNDNTQKIDVHPKEKEAAPVSDEDAALDVTDNNEQEAVADQNKINKNDQVVSTKKASEAQQDDELTSKNNVATNNENTGDSAEQLMSFLSASKKILSHDKSESKVTQQLDENLVVTNDDKKVKTKSETEIDALLKQMLTGEKNKTIEQNTEGSTKSSNNEVATKQSKAKPEINIEGLVKKVDVKGDIKNKKTVETETNSEVNNNNSIEKVLDKNASTEQHLNAKNIDPLTELTNKNIKPENLAVAEDKASMITKQQMSASEIEALLSDMENTPTGSELEKLKAELLVNQESNSSTEQSNKNNKKLDALSDEKAKKPTLEQLEPLAKTLNESVIDNDILNTDKVAFAGVTVSGEKQAQESNQNHSRVINQATQKVVDQQTSNTGEQSQEQSLAQENKKQIQGLTDTEKLANSETQVKDKSFNEIFDKKLISKSIENTLDRELNKVNEATKPTVSSEDMIMKLASDSAQSTLQSVTNAKQVTSLQNEALSVYRKDFAGAVKDKVMVMMNQKLQQIEIRLDPQELGNVNVKINLQNEQAIVSFTVQNQQAKEALDQNLGRLKEMLAESGVDVGDANVEQQNKQNDEDQQSDERHSGSEAFDGGLSELSDTQTLNLVKGSSTGIDYYA